MANRLRALGVADPVVEGTLDVHPLAHGVSTRDRALRDCERLPRRGLAPLRRRYVLAAYLPGRHAAAAAASGGRVELAGMIGPTAGGGLVLSETPEAAAGGLHVLGHSRQALTNTLGFPLFVAVVPGRRRPRRSPRVALRRRRGAHRAARRREKDYVFGRYERLWHWTMALAGIVLIVTGLEVHGGERLRPA